MTKKKIYFLEIQEAKNAVEWLHDCKATFVESVEVLETFQGQTVWEGIVHIFEVTGHPTAKRAYAWSSPIEGSTKRKFFSVLEISPVTSAKDAVRVAIVYDHKVREGI